MEEIFAVLHANFPRLLMNWDKQPVSPATGAAAGKSPGFSTPRDRVALASPGLWVLWTRFARQALSTARPPVNSIRKFHKLLFFNDFQGFSVFPPSSQGFILVRDYPRGNLYRLGIDFNP
ncbi:hypothetical protein P7F60_14645 [Rhizobium sp. YJ-22]|uniref:hypothetical protein n=1 Tax=Rhizobium sp. YJ-22 TaxID=3037556 RepID=UPI0024123B6E|nr:hypothetical protein [Rhizobium sp. YJ-22]MDG3577633.1 hypothetical protein [Rhizobium sp. YJ-22]